MKEVIQQLKDFIKAQKTAHWLTLFVFCGISVYINYAYGMQQKIDELSGIKEFLAFVALYGVHTIFGYLAYSFFYKKYDFWAKPGFWALLILSFVIFTFRAVTYQHADWIGNHSPDGQIRINQFVYNDIFRLLYLVIPVAVVWYIFDRKNEPFYGVSFKNHKAKLYWTLLLCMVPLIVFASTQADFLAYYPRFNKIAFMNPPTWKLWMYELCYGLDFSSIELFFRGFLVMAFTRYVGINAVLPMACFYLSIHYGKPMGEAISSFFGGTILGVIAFYSRSIFGGIMVHAGIAWLMEIGGFIGNYFKH